MTTKITAPPYHVADRMLLASVDVLDVTNTPVARCYANRHGTNGAFAQARLFAAAPEMLDSLRELLAIMERQLAHIAAPPGISGEQAAAVLRTDAYKTAAGRVDRARAAIVKAEAGEEALAEMKQGRR